MSILSDPQCIQMVGFYIVSMIAMGLSVDVFFARLAERDARRWDLEQPILKGE